MFALQNAPVPALEAPGLRLTPLAVDSGTSKFALSLFATETAEGLELVMEYSAELFEPATVDRMLVHYRVLLEEALTHPERPVGELAMVTDEERRQLLARWSGPARDGLGANWEGAADGDVDFLFSEPV
jgi:non-ribosomal peptide synthetase component F